MSFRLFSILLLLVPLVFADPAPVGKILFDGSDDGYILTENFHPRLVQYGYYSTGGQFPYHLKFEIKSHNPLNRWEVVDIRRNLANEANLTFAIDIYPYTRGYEVSCYFRSSESLKHLLEKCQGNVLLRDTLTDKEQKEIEEFKKEHKRTGKQFEVTYVRRQLNIASVAQQKFQLTGEQNHDEHFIKLNAYGQDSVERSMWLQDETLKGSSFVIDGLAKDSGVDCYGTHRELVPITCKGDITIKQKIFPFPG